MQIKNRSKFVRVISPPSGITSEITEPEPLTSLLIHTRKSGFACIVLLFFGLFHLSLSFIIVVDSAANELSKRIVNHVAG